MIGPHLRLALLVLAAAVLSSCANDPVGQSSRAPVEYGYVKAIEIYRGSDDKPVSVRMLIGGIAGGVLGHQIGSGTGNTVATIAGAIGGAMVGHELEQKVSGSRYRITVLLDYGGTVTIEDSREVELRVGDRVRIDNHRVTRL